MYKLLNISYLIITFLFPNIIKDDDELQKKVLRINDFDIECYVSLKEISTFDDSKMYYWYKSGAIHNTTSSVGGDVLHDKYSKYYNSNQLAEQGAFNYGLKNGEWKTWNENGHLNEAIEWKKGAKNGAFKSYDTRGNVLEKGSYRNNKKIGAWVNFVTKDTLFFKAGKVLSEEKLKNKKNLLKRLFTKKDSLAPVKKNKSKKDNFFKRIFKKKDAPNKVSKNRNTRSNKTKHSKKESFFKRLFKTKNKKVKAKKKH